MLRLAIPMLLLLCLVACGDDAASERGAVPVEVVTTTTVTMQPWHDRIRALGTVKARESVARSDEHTSELQSLMRNSYAVFCLKTKTKKQNSKQQTSSTQLTT